MSQQPLLSIVIPAFNEEAHLAHTITHIQDTLKTSSFTWELIVCDNHSTDHTVEVAKRHGAKVVQETHRQISRVRNTGANAAKGSWLLFFDADSFPPQALMDEIKDLLLRDEVVGCGTTVTVYDGTLLNKLRLERLNPLFRLFQLSGGACLLCRAEAFRVIGGFSIALYALEDIDFVIRLKRYGRRQGTRFVVLHEHPVMTSGRKGEYTIRSLLTMYVSNFVAVVLFCFSFLLPESWVGWLGRSCLGYWYRARK